MPSVWHNLKLHIRQRVLGARIRAENRSPNRDARHLMGIAKKRAARALSEAGLVAEGIAQISRSAICTAFVAAPLRI